MKCKDIPDRPILEFLARNPERWHNWLEGFENSVLNAMPAGIDGKLALAKMRMMIRREVVDGCPCGCRGDFVITAKGLAELEANPRSIGTTKE